MSGDHKVDQALLKDITSGVELKKIETQEKNSLPSVIDISAEKTVKAIETFDASNLTHTETVEKSGWKEAFSHDKATVELSKFDKTQLKHTETAEKNPLPDADVISQEKQERELRHSIGAHDRSSLKKVTPVEKDALKELVALEATHCAIEKFNKDQLKHAKLEEKKQFPTVDDICD